MSGSDATKQGGNSVRFQERAYRLIKHNLHCSSGFFVVFKGCNAIFKSCQKSELLAD